MLPPAWHGRRGHSTVRAQHSLIQRHIKMLQKVKKNDIVLVLSICAPTQFVNSERNYLLSL